MLTILHVSDLHFGPPFVPRVGEALLRIAPTLQPDVVVVSGDLTQCAKPEQFAAARDYIGRLPAVPKVVIPGNHDVALFRVAERLFRPYDLYRQYIGQELDQVLRIEGAVIVSLNSTAPRRAITNGRIRRRQLEFCQRAFETAPEGAARIVVTHHHFAPAPDYLRDQTLPRAKRAMSAFLDFGVELILGGHLHRAYIGNSLDFFPSGKSKRGVIIVQCGTSTSRRGRGREREKNSFNLIEIGPEMLQVTHFIYFDDDDHFAPLSRHLYPRPGRRFVEGPRGAVGRAARMIVCQTDPVPVVEETGMTEPAPAQ